MITSCKIIAVKSMSRTGLRCLCCTLSKFIMKLMDVVKLTEPSYENLNDVVF